MARPIIRNWWEMRRATVSLIIAVTIVLGLSGRDDASARSAVSNSSPFLVTRSGDTYTARSETTGQSYSGALNSVVESAVSDLDPEGGTVRFSGGTFDLGTDYFKLVNVHNLTFEGAGIDVTFIQNWTSADADTEPFNFSGAFGITIRDMSVSAGGPVRLSSDAIDFDEGNDSVVERVKITAARGRAIVFDGKNAGWTSANNVVRDCIIDGVAGDGVEFLASSNNLVEGCTITNTARNGINSAKASPTADQPNKKSTGNIIRNNVIDNAGIDGILITSGDGNRVEGNRITNSSDDVPTADGIRITSADQVACDSNVVEGNIATDNQATKTQRYGLNIASSLCTMNAVGGGNDFTGNRQGAINDLGTNTQYAADTVSPSVPTGLTATASYRRQIDLGWTASTDSVGVTAYEIFRDGSLLTTIGPQTTYWDAAVEPGSTHSYYVRARDAAGNVSGPSLTASATTPTSGELFLDGFETGDFSKWTLNEGLVVQQSDVFAGASAAKAVSNASAGASAYRLLAQSERDLYYAARFKILNQSANVNLLRFRSATAASALVTLFVASTGKVGLRNDVTDFYTTSSPASPGVWHFAQVHVVIDGGSSRTEAWLDGISLPELSQSGNLGTDPISRVELGDPSPGKTFAIAFDDVAYDRELMGADATPLAAPSNLHSTALSATQVDLAWDASNDSSVSGYRIYRNGGRIAEVGASTLAHADATVSQGATYTYIVTARDAAGNESAASNPLEIQIPQPPTVSVAISQPNGFINAGQPDPYTVTATSPDLLAEVEFFRCSDGSADCASGTWSSLGVDASAPYSAPWPLDPEGSRALRAVARAAGGAQAQAIVNVTIDRTPPAGGSVSYPDGWSSGPVVITTTDGTDGGSGIAAGSGAIERQETGLTGAGCDAFTGGWTAAVSPDATVQGAHCYRYRYRVADRAGNTSAYTSTNVVKVDAQAPTVPSGLSAVAVSPTQVNLSWTASSDDLAIAGYTVRRDGQVLATLAATVTSYSDQAAQPATTHSYTVQAFDQVQNRSPESAPTQATTPAVFVAVADAYVTSSAPSTNFGTATSLRLDLSPLTGSYLRFSPSGLVGTVKKATLRVYPTSSLSAGFEVRPVSSTSWGETTIKYQNAPAVGAMLARSGAVTSGSWVALDVSAAVTGNGTFSFALTPLSSTLLSVSSREGSKAPELVVETQASANRAPDARPVVLSTDEDVQGSWTPAVSDPDGNALTCSIVTAPAHGLATVASNCSSGTYMPSPNYNGPDSLTYRVSDGTLSDDSLVSASVRAVNDAPLVQADRYTAPPGQLLVVVAANGVLANDSDADGQPFAAVPASGVGHGVLTVSADGSFAYRPTVGFTGQDSFTYRAWDGTALSAAATVTIDVQAPSGLRFGPDADAYVSQASPLSNYGSSSSLRVESSSNAIRSYIRFPISGLAGTVKKATLRLYANSSSTGGTDVRGLANPSAVWSEKVLTWKSAPVPATTVAGTSGGFAGGAWVDVDVTALVQSNGDLTLVLDRSASGSCSFSSREGGHPPELVVETNS